MIRQEFPVQDYWKVIVLYNLDYDFSDVIIHELKDIDFSDKEARMILYELQHSAKAVTCSKEEKHVSVVLFNRHSSKADYINSIVHEAEHVKQAMLKAYRVDDEGEPPAYTIGYLIGRMYPVFRDIICNCC